MKWTIIILMAVFFTTTGCQYPRKQKELQQKEAALDQKEQELSLREKALQLREDNILKREKFLDSAAKSDTTQLINPNLVGKWSVKMTCTETSCSGSAVGDTKTEQWQMTYEGNILVATAMLNNQVSRIYKGFYTGNTVELVEKRKSTDDKATKMIVRLRIVDETHLDGQREIDRQDCKVIYNLQMEKQNG